MYVENQFNGRISVFFLIVFFQTLGRNIFTTASLINNYWMSRFFVISRIISVEVGAEADNPYPFRMAPFSLIVFGVVVWTIAASGAKQLRFCLKTD